MKKSYATQLSGQIGEHLVVAELGRLGIVATPLAGHVPDIDLLTYWNGKSVAIQVKALRSGDVSVDAAHYLDIEFEGTRQIVKGKSTNIDRDLIFVLVVVGSAYGDDRFYVFHQGLIQDLIFDKYTNWLAKNDGIRPRNPRTTHSAYNETDVLDRRNRWDVIKAALSG